MYTSIPYFSNINQKSLTPRNDSCLSFRCIWYLFLDVEQQKNQQPFILYCTVIVILFYPRLLLNSFCAIFNVCVQFVEYCSFFCPFFYWSLHCLSFFNLRLLITPLVSHPCISFYFFFIFAFAYFFLSKANTITIYSFLINHPLLTTK